MDAIQDLYPELAAHCYGCGRLNEHGLHIQSYAEGDEAVCRFRPRPYHTAIPGFVYGGLIAALIDCHATGSAAIAAHRAEGSPPTAGTAIRFVTASLKVDFLKPTPIDAELELRARTREVKGRKVVLDIDLSANGVVTARGEAVCVRMPDDFGQR